MGVGGMAALAAPLGVLLAMRIGAALFLAPGLGGRALPGRLRAVLTLLLAVSMAPAQMTAGWCSQADVWATVWRLGPRELAIGLLLGLTVRLLVTGAAVAGQLLGEMAGGAGSIGESADSDGSGQLNALARLMEWTAIAVFLLAGGHRHLVDGIMDSYVSWPLSLDHGQNLNLSGSHLPDGGRASVDGTGNAANTAAESLVAALTRGSSIALRIALPALIAAGTTTLMAGLLSRVLPQMETLSWMAALIWFVVLGSIALGLASLGSILPMELESLWDSTLPSPISEPARMESWPVKQATGEHG